MYPSLLGPCPMFVIDLTRVITGIGGHERDGREHEVSESSVVRRGCRIWKWKWGKYPRRWKGGVQYRSVDHPQESKGRKVWLRS
jgi:hypothetical protein